MANRKLGRPTDQRLAVLKNQVTDLLWYGKIETTVDRAKEVRRIAEKLITLAIKTYKDEVEVSKTRYNLSGDAVAVKFKNDGPKKLSARRKLMSSLYDIQEQRQKGEKNSTFRDRTKDINHPLIEKIFNNYAPTYADRAEKLGQGGGYTRIIKLGTRRGDNAELAILELV
ncbi:MAG: 50S ribosomal protein L17 [Clostridiales bacterium]|jgi:large subunit ribosomal protein L17|nr:50S ribosomal protein L17 [Clostridiales bacterium]